MMGVEDGSLFDRSFVIYCFTPIEKLGMGGLPTLRDTGVSSIVLDHVDACTCRRARNGLAGSANVVDLSLCRHMRGYHRVQYPCGA
jgi:hypothetical protein